MLILIVSISAGSFVESPFRLLLVLVLALILISLGEAMYYMAKDSGRTDRTRVVRALTVRIVLSLFLFAMIITGHSVGWIG
jgi:hypothetical protein